MANNDNVKIVTNNVPRDILYPHDLSMVELKEFEYLIDADDRDNDEELQTKWCDSGAQFFRYRGDLYDFSNFVRIELQSARTNSFCIGVEEGSPLLKWDGAQSDSYFSATLIRYARDEYGQNDEQIIVGRYTC